MPGRHRLSLTQIASSAGIGKMPGVSKYGMISSTPSNKVAQTSNYLVLRLKSGRP